MSFDVATLLRSVLEAIGDAVVVLDRHRRVTVWSAAATRTFGWSAAEMLGQTLADICPPDLDGAVDERLTRVLAGEGVTGEWPARHQRGTTVWVDVGISALTDEHGTVTGILGVARDVTQLREARRKVADDGRRDEHAAPTPELDGFLDLAPDAIIGARDDGHIAFVNRQAELVFGYTRAELVGRSIDLLLPERDRVAHAEHRLDYSHNPRTRLMSPGKRRVTGLRRDGTEFPVEVSLSVVRVKGGPTTLCMVRDVSERERIEASLLDAIREKEALLREIYHRVKNNLQVVSSLLSLQAEDVHDKRDAELFRESQGRVRAMALVHEKLCQSGSLAQIDAREYIEDLVRKIRQVQRVGAHVTVRVEVEPCSCPVDVAIPAGLILNELFSNAIKHAFPGGTAGEIVVSLRIGPPGHMAMIVRDDGIGMSTDAPARRSLGLSLVGILTKQLGGEFVIQPASESGGTEARVSFVVPTQKGTG